jgi:hypothetical protein
MEHLSKISKGVAFGVLPSPRYQGQVIVLHYLDRNVLKETI